MRRKTTRKRLLTLANSRKTTSNGLAARQRRDVIRFRRSTELCRGRSNDTLPQPIPRGADISLTGANHQAGNWIADGDKYALIGLEVKFDEDLPLTQLTPNHWAMADPRFSIPEHWRGWLGSMRTEELESCNLFLISKMASTAPDVLDGENQILSRCVSHFYTGLLLSSIFAPSHRPVLLTGSRRDGQTGIRSQSDFETPIPHSIRHYPSLLKSEIEEAARLAAALEAVVADTSRSNWRFFRALTLYVETRSLRDNMERLHQYCRCIEGLIMAEPGKALKQFKSRTELFIGPRHHDLMGEMYEVRSAVEHLHEHRYLEKFDREVRLGLLRKEVVAEHIARTTLARIAGNDAILQHFANSTALEAFWALTPQERREIWGDPINLDDALAGYDPRYISDGQLGGS